MIHQPKKYDFIDALRGLAFLAVFVSHLSHHAPATPKALSRLLDSGDKGVQLFFIASALTLFLSMASRKKEERRPIRNFFIRRFFRIAPLFYVAAFFYRVALPRLHAFPPPSGEITPGAVISTLTFTHGWGPYWINLIVPGGWSIAVEMTFYLLVPALFARVKGLESALRWTLAAHLAGIALTVATRPMLARWGVNREDQTTFFLFWFPNQTTAFGAGIALYFLIRDRLKSPHPEAAGDGGSTRSRSAWLLVAAAYIFPAVAASDLRYFLHLPLFDVSLVLFALALSEYPYRFFVNRVTRWLGLHSFSGYLTHFAALEWAHRLLPIGGAWYLQLLGHGALALAITAGLSAITYRLIEVPGQALGKRLIARLESSEPRPSLAFPTEVAEPPHVGGRER